jgi:hypothetical protein
MAWYGWFCFIALPFLIYEWLKERKEAAIERRIRQLPYQPADSYRRKMKEGR